MPNAPQCLADETLFAFVLGQLPSGSRADVERHLSDCDECRKVVAETARSVTQEESSRSSVDATQRIGRYALLGLLGAGAYGVVYRAFDPDLRRTVALKVLRPDEHSQDAMRRDRMVREAQAMAQLSHPNVVAVYDVGVHGDTVYIVMEYVAGGTARDFLNREPRSVVEVLGMYLQAGRGLAAAHAKGLVHRDFKPENVLVGGDGQVRVTDFGLARIVDGGAAGSSAVDPNQPVELSTTKGLVGTPGYVAPEQFAGGAADARSDQFSFCVAVFSGLYGRHPFRAEAGVTLEELSVRVRAGAVEVISDAERVPHVHRVLLRGLHNDPRERLPSMDALLVALEAALRPSNRWRKRALAALLTVGSLLGLALWSHEHATGPASALLVSRSQEKTRSPGRAAVTRSEPNTVASVEPGVGLASGLPSRQPAPALGAKPARARPAPSGLTKPREQRYVDGLKEPF